MRCPFELTEIRWVCERRRFHLGHHRCGRYTACRIPHVWRVWRLWERHRSNNHYQQYDMQPLSYRTVLYPVHFDPH